MFWVAPVSCFTHPLIVYTASLTTLLVISNDAPFQVSARFVTFKQLPTLPPVTDVNVALPRPVNPSVPLLNPAFDKSTGVKSGSAVEPGTGVTVTGAVGVGVTGAGAVGVGDTGAVSVGTGVLRA